MSNYTTNALLNILCSSLPLFQLHYNKQSLFFYFLFYFKVNNLPLLYVFIKKKNVFTCLRNDRSSSILIICIVIFKILPILNRYLYFKINFVE